jgi:protein TonB
MKIKTALATSIFTFLLCAGVTLRAQDSPAPAQPPENPEAPDAAPASSPRPTRVRIGGNIAATMITHRVRPKYPDEAKQNHISGTIVLHAVVGLDGHVQQLQFVSGPPELMRSAMDAVRQWRYKPLKLNRKVVEFDTMISVAYRLSG